MENGHAGWTLAELAAMLGGEASGPADLIIRRPVILTTPHADGIGFAENARYLAQALASPIGALLVSRETPPIEKACIRVESPRLAFLKLLHLARRPVPLEPGISPLAAVSELAQVDPSASVGAFAVVERGARIGPHCRVYPHAYVGEDCLLEAYCEVLPHAVLVQSVALGERTVVESGAVLGADGFGYVWDGERHVKIPQVGGVRIGMDGNIGALTAIDRATAGETVLGVGVKIDNLVQIGHNGHIGNHTVVAGNVAIAGSVTIGSRTTIGGHTAVTDHTEIGDDVKIGGYTGVTKNLASGGIYAGFPARTYKEALAGANATVHLPALIKRVEALERRLAELESA
jgi:UDP-3-O-[3-hydroxymyristoyl] glucosamine N-acyltransferase